ncbi:MAG: WecB/TagA/CpsF family glycosyltransferase [Verrucomicrobia bacterium]|nr:WecB/TagA/CpsF family glycosyltransferase [Verrucomicrobiota bacterium]MCF7708705.1 WecB/TagA/CpsF family glycosyltransferase [Verrucomicrobiota bacterium]
MSKNTGQRLVGFRFGDVRCSSHSIEDLLEEIRGLLSDRAAVPRTVLCLNAHIYNIAAGDARLRRCLSSARVVAADGMSVVWGARLFGVNISERCNMTEAFREFLVARRMPPSRAIIMGCSGEEAAAAAARINGISPHCRITGAYSGYLNDDECRTVFKAERGVDFIFLGMGTPRTEYVSQLAAVECPGAIVWGIGGGTVRIYAGSMKEAPALLRRLGLQWMDRLIREPWVLWRRYLIGNPVFAVRVLLAGMRGRIGYR